MNPARRETNTVIRWQIVLVLGLSLGRSSIYAIVDLAEKLFTAPLSEQSTVMNSPLSPHPAFDLIRQLLSIGFSLIPVALALYFIWIWGRNPFRALGLDFRKPGRDIGWGLALFAVIGVGTVGVYLGGRAAGLTTQIVANDMDPHWWTPFVLILSAFRHGIIEEVIVVAWLIDRLERLGRTSPVVLVLVSALLRGSYHLYQGIGPGVGNFLMGVLFAIFYLCHRRVMPLVIAHGLLDTVGFVGFPLLARLGWLG